MNLNFINEAIFDKRVNNKIFDNFWYLTREKNLREKPYTGFVVSCTTSKVEKYQKNKYSKLRIGASEKNSKDPGNYPVFIEDPVSPRAHSPKKSTEALKVGEKEIKEPNKIRIAYKYEQGFKLISSHSLLQLIKRKK